MRNRLSVFSVTVLLLLSVTALMAQASEQSVFRVQRLSDRVLLLTERSPMENIIVTIATEKGLVVFDSTGSPYTAGLAREVIKKELARSDFAYLINTHDHWDHAWGDQAFADTTIIAYEGTAAALAGAAAQIPRSVTQFQQRLDEEQERLDQLNPESAEAQEVRRSRDFNARLCRGLGEGFVATLPHITFNDRMTLNLGDITLQLFYFGSAHSGNDIFILVPEEQLLLTGDVFLDIGWLPLFAGQAKLDIDRWIEVLHAVLEGEAKVATVIPAHRKVWSRAKLVLWRDYIAELWEGMKAAEAEGLSLDNAQRRFPLPEQCRYLLELGHEEAALQQFHESNATAFWRQLKESAAQVVEQLINEQGIEAALNRFRELQAQPTDIYFEETDFNALGYRLLSNNQVAEAIEIFKLNAAAFPESWNVYDSLGEAYMVNGDRELAIKSYRRSIEFNPENQNGITMLKTLEGGE